MYQKYRTAWPRFSEPQPTGGMGCQRDVSVHELCGHLSTGVMVKGWRTIPTDPASPAGVIKQLLVWHRSRLCESDMSSAVAQSIADSKEICLDHIV